MRKTLFLALLSLTSVSTSAVPAAAYAGGGAGRIPTVTRLVRIFSGLEGNLAEAVEKRDRQAVSKLLSNDFEMRVGAMPGNPIPRAAWIQQSFASPKSSSAMEQMAVHGLGKTAVVSYAWKTTARKSGVVHDVFVVDVWRQQDGGWKLAIRYADPAGAGDFNVPGAAPVTPVFEKKE